MAQLVLVILIMAAAFGIYRCSGSETADANKSRSDLEKTLQAPARVEQEMKQQVDQVNQRNREMLDRY